MFGQRKQSEKSRLDAAIDKVLTELTVHEADSAEYIKLVAHLETLTTLRSKSRMIKVSPDTMAIVIGNLVGIALIVGYEHAHVVTSKSLNFILKPKS